MHYKLPENAMNGYNFVIARFENYKITFDIGKNGYIG